MAKTSAYVLYAPFGPTNVFGHQHENDAYKHAEWLCSHNTLAVAVIGQHSRDELQAALRSHRRLYVRALADQLAAQAAAS